MRISDWSSDVCSSDLEFILAAREQTSLGLGTGPYVKNVFVKALGEEKAGSVLGRMSATSPQKGIEILDWMDARSIVATISGEHPQVIAEIGRASCRERVCQYV